MTAIATFIFRGGHADTLRRLRRKLLAQIRALHILKAQNDEAFIDDLLVQMNMLRKAYDNELNSLTPKRLHEIYVNIIEIRERVRSIERDYNAEEFNKFMCITHQISMVAKWTYNIATQKIN